MSYGYISVKYIVTYIYDSTAYILYLYYVHNYLPVFFSGCLGKLSLPIIFYYVIAQIFKVCLKKYLSI